MTQIKARGFGYVVIREDFHSGDFSIVASPGSLRAAEALVLRYREAAERECLPYVYSIRAEAIR